MINDDVRESTRHGTTKDGIPPLDAVDENGRGIADDERERTVASVSASTSKHVSHVPSAFRLVPADMGIAAAVRVGIAAPGRERGTKPLSVLSRDLTVVADGLGRARNRQS
jgi:hypothetical protein